MRAGDLVKINLEGLSLNVATMVLGHTGVIIGIRKAFVTEFSVMINGKIARFLPRSLEVINESR